MKKRKNNSPMFVGLDPSFNGTGIIVLDSQGEIIEQTLHKAKEGEVEERLLDIEKKIKFIPTILNLEIVYIEGPSYSSSGAFVLQMGALHYLIRLIFLKKKINYKVIAPGTLKKFVAGTGVAKKELMLLKTYKKWGVEFDDNNLCDAYGLARMAFEDFKDENNR
jgi:Holliday junction resolvasome RuvABC endonuclease subunit